LHATSVHDENNTKRIKPVKSYRQLYWHVLWFTVYIILEWNLPRRRAISPSSTAAAAAAFWTYTPD